MPNQLTFALFRNRAEAQQVAEGVVFGNGKVVLAWMKENRTVSVYDSMADMFKANCQDGETRVLWGYSEMAHSRHLLPSLG